ncbi:MAG: PilN domain-containing protein [Nitrospiraceae bacterium]|nr:PilN domain-containing protein [Nitrospiraceae bacterium]
MMKGGLADQTGEFFGRALRHVVRALSLLTFSAADLDLQPRKILSLSIEQGAVDAALGRGCFLGSGIIKANRYEIGGKAYPEPADLVPAAKSVCGDKLSGGKNGPDGCDATLVIPGEWVIRRDADFPAAIRNDLPNAVSYDLDRLLPFGADRVFYDWRITGEKGRRLAVRVSAVKLEKVKPYIDRLGEKGIAVSRVICPDETQAAISWAKWGILDTIRSNAHRSNPGRPNLLNNGRRESARAPVAATALLIALLFGAWGYGATRPTGIETEKVAALNRRLTSEKRKVSGVEFIARQIGMLNGEISTIKDFDLGRPAALRTLKELTALIPKSAWLTGLKFTEDSVQIEGYASSAAGLIPRLEKSGYFKKVEFASATTRDAQTESDHFIIKMSLAPAIPAGKKKSAPGGDRIKQ